MWWRRFTYSSFEGRGVGEEGKRKGRERMEEDRQQVGGEEKKQ